jgi:hypothetical protein
LLSGFFNYGFIMLDGIAAGVDEPPVLSIEMMNPISGQRTLMLLFLCMGAFFVSDAAVYWMGRLPAALLGFAGAMLLPAMLAVQGATGSLAQSFNAWRCWRLIQRLGSDYVLIVACVALFCIAGYLVVSSSLGASLPIVVRIAAFMYGWLATFALIGGVLHERRTDIGLDDADTPERVQAVAQPDERERDQLIDRIYAQWRGGAHGNAWQTITVLVEQSDDPLLELRWMYDRVARWPDPRLADRLARAFMPRLLAAHRNGEALDVARQRLRATPDFRPTAAVDLLHLVRLARDAGDRPAARLLLRDFERHYPQDALPSMADELQQQLAR